MKRIISLLLSVLLVVPCVCASAVSNKVLVTMDGVEMSFDVEPVIEKGTTLVPFRAIFEALGCVVSYQAEGGMQFVEAQRGRDYVSLQIGSELMYFNGEEVKLAVAPKIVNGRTLVPLRVISEKLDCTVDWIGETRTATINRRRGQAEIHTGNVEKIVKAEDGTVLMDVICAYPIVDLGSESDFINGINEYYRKHAEDYIKTNVDELSEDAEIMHKEMGNQYRPMHFRSSYEVNVNRADLLSITVADYANTNGAHPNTVLSSKTYHLKLESELSVDRIFDIDTDKAEALVYDKFSKWLSDNGLADYNTSEDALEEAVKNVNFYLTDNSAVLYFNTYDIAPYAAGVPMVEIPFTGADGVLKIDLSGANLDKLEFELKGNPTTGYEWQIAAVNSDKISVDSEYIPDEVPADIVGSGGKYKFTVTGIAQGNAEIECSYLRPFEKDGKAEKTVIYRVYVSKDKKITVLERIERKNTKNAPTERFFAVILGILTMPQI